MNVKEKQFETTKKPELPPVVAAVAKREAKRMLEEVKGMTAVVVATLDGFDVASAMNNGEADRVAAMASSIAAISAVVSEEAELGRSKSVTIATEGGFALVYSIYRDDMELVAILIANGQAVLGQANYSAAQLARKLSEA